MNDSSPLKLHIISFDVPAPPDYGGAIDVFYKIKSLSEAGCEIYLHCFRYGRPESKVLEQLCKEVWYYPRSNGWMDYVLGCPYLVGSRKNSLLTKRLEEIDAPILMDGLHTSFYASLPALQNRFKMLRTHNVEHDYYKYLGEKEDSFYKKIFYKRETALLKKWEEKRLQNFDTFLHLSLADQQFYQSLYPNAGHQFIPAFHSFETIRVLEGRGKYCLYHGNLAHNENKEAVRFLLEKVIPKVNTSFIISGRNPGKQLVRKIHSLPNVTLQANPSEETLNKLMQEAQIHILPTFQQSGLKLKLLHALYSGRHVLVNKNMIFGTTLREVCTLAETGEDFIYQIGLLMQREVTEAEKTKREKALLAYNNPSSAAKIIALLRQKSL